MDVVYWRAPQLHASYMRLPQRTNGNIPSLPSAEKQSYFFTFVHLLSCSILITSMHLLFKMRAVREHLDTMQGHVYRGHEATETGLAYAPVSQAHGHNHIVQCLACCTAA